ncbi:MAG: hypothetical protein V2I62_07250 [Bacteroidales bacterium]|jgi:hypothetical protein|nr:hypothetical protein [Bacteroidales bacterium]
MNDKALKVSTPISDIGMIVTERIDCDSYNGTLKIIFINSNKANEVERYQCVFNSYITFKVTHEDFDCDTDDVPKIKEPASEYYGNVIRYLESLWLSKYTETTMYIHGNRDCPNHYFFVAIEDSIEVLSHDEPVITLM